MESMLAKEKAKTTERIAELKEETELEQLRKEELECERELVVLKRPSIWDLIKRAFRLRKGGKEK